MKKLIVFLRHNNDIDHITPILHKWILTRNITTDIIITTDEKLLVDYRIKHLRTLAKNRKNINIYHINDFFRGAFWRWFNNFYAKNSSIEEYPFVQNWIEKNAKFLIDKLTRDITGEKDMVVCFDWNSNLFVKNFIVWCKIYGIPTVALPHGDEPYVNKMQKDADTTYGASLMPYIQRSIFDYVLVPNKLCATHYDCVKNVTEVKVLGSPRYCAEWMKLHISENQRKSTTNQPLKIALFLRNSHWPVNWSELHVLLKMMTQFDTSIIIKSHARGNFKLNPYSFNYPNTKIDIYNTVIPSSLIDWADVIIDVGTSTIWEAVVKNKPILMLDYICGNKPTISRYMPQTRITCRDDLYENLRKFSKNPTRATYTPEQRKKFMKEMIESTPKTLERYCKFIEGLFND